MIINSLTGQKFSQAEILEKSNFSHFWEKAISPSGDGIILEKMGLILADLLSSLNLNHYSVEVIHMNPQFKGSKERAMKALASVSRDNGRSQVLLGNFLQSRLVGDSDTASGHYSPVGGFDLATQSVYLSEPDGGSLRPAWNSITDFFLATETFDESSGNYRGFIWIYPK